MATFLAIGAPNFQVSLHDPLGQFSLAFTICQLTHTKLSPSLLFFCTLQGARNRGGLVYFVCPLPSSTESLPYISLTMIPKNHTQSNRILKILFTSPLFIQKHICSLQHNMAILPGTAINKTSQLNLDWCDSLSVMSSSLSAITPLSFSVLPNWKLRAVVFRNRPQPHSSKQSLFSSVSLETGCSLLRSDEQ